VLLNWRLKFMQKNLARLAVTDYKHLKKRANHLNINQYNTLHSAQLLGYVTDIKPSLQT